jgi:hypothetical protein
MIRNSHSHPWLLTLLCVALLMVRVGGAHLHLCFDGGEPPASVHLFDNDQHHADDGLSAVHHDQDVSLIGDVIAKFSKLHADLPVLVIATLLFWALLRVPREPAPGYRQSFFSSVSRLLRPPLRGPPLLTSL